MPQLAQAEKKMRQPFVPNAPFFYPLKTSENLLGFLIFSGARERVHWEQLALWNLKKLDRVLIYISQTLTVLKLQIYYFFERLNQKNQ